MASLMALGGLNRSRLSLSVLDDLPQIIRLWLVGAGFLVVVSQLATGHDAADAAARRAAGDHR